MFTEDELKQLKVADREINRRRIGTRKKAHKNYAPDRDELKRLTGRGFTRREIGERMGYDPYTIGKNQKLLGIYKDEQPINAVDWGVVEDLLASGYSVKRVAAECGCHYSSIYKWKKAQSSPNLPARSAPCATFACSTQPT